MFQATLECSNYFIEPDRSIISNLYLSPTKKQPIRAKERSCSFKNMVEFLITGLCSAPHLYPDTNLLISHVFLRLNQSLVRKMITASE